MTLTTVTGAKAAIVTALASVTDVRVYGFEPAAGDVPTPAAVAVSTGPQGTPEDWTFHVRIYVDPTIGADRAQALLDSLTDTVDVALRGDSRFGTGEFENGFDDASGWHLCLFTVTVGREDF